MSTALRFVPSESASEYGTQRALRTGFGVYLFLRIWWRAAARFAMQERLLREAPLSPETLQTFFSLAIGFAVAGLVASTYQLVTRRAANFRLLQRGPQAARFAAIPMLVFAAPFIIMRNAIRGRRIERRRFEFVFASTFIAGLWSLMSGSVVVMALQALGLGIV